MYGYENIFCFEHIQQCSGVALGLMHSAIIPGWLIGLYGTWDGQHLTCYTTAPAPAKTNLLFVALKISLESKQACKVPN